MTLSDGSFGWGLSILVSAIVAATAGCSGDAGAASEASFGAQGGKGPLSTESVEVDWRGDGADVLVGQLTLRDRLGSLEGPGPGVFGRIADVELESEGPVLVLDRHSRTIRLFGPDGGFLSEIGGEGVGPGEFRDPIALVPDEAGRVFALDRSARLVRFRLEGDSLVHERTKVLGFNPYDACAVGGHVFVAGVHRGAVIQSFSPDGVWEGSFGRPAEAADGVVGTILSEARLACSPEDNVILHVPVFRPVVRAFRPDGRRMWTDTLPGYRPVRVTEAGQSGASFAWSTAEGTHRAVSVVADGRGRFLVQLGVKDTSRSDPRDFREVATHVYDASTGHLALSSREFPWLVDVGPGRAAGLRPLPYPEVRLYSLETE